MGLFDSVLSGAKSKATEVAIDLLMNQFVSKAKTFAAPYKVKEELVDKAMDTISTVIKNSATGKATVAQTALELAGKVTSNITDVISSSVQPQKLTEALKEAYGNNKSSLSALYQHLPEGLEPHVQSCIEGIFSKFSK